MAVADHDVVAFADQGDARHGKQEAPETPETLEPGVSRAGERRAKRKTAPVPEAVSLESNVGLVPGGSWAFRAAALHGSGV